MKKKSIITTIRSNIMNNKNNTPHNYKSTPPRPIATTNLLYGNTHTHVVEPSLNKIFYLRK